MSSCCNIVDTNLDASGNVIQVMNPHQRGVHGQVKNRNESKQVLPKNEDLSRSLDIRVIWKLDTEFPTIFNEVKLAWRSGSVMDCHATARGSIPGGNGVENRASRTSQGTVNWGAVSK